MIGLSSEEVAKKTKNNSLPKIKRKSFGKVILGNLDDPIMKILLIAFAIDLIFVLTGKSNWYEAVGILIAILLSILVSSVSEYSNESSFQELKAENDKVYCEVYRDGEVQKTLIDDIVEGDVIVVHSGDIIPVDGHIIEGKINVNQSSLNGENKSVCKIKNFSKIVSPDLLDEYSLFRGSVVTENFCTLVADKVGVDTMYGQIAQGLSEDNNRLSPLQLKLGKLAKQISIFGYIGAILIFLMFLLRDLLFERYENFTVVNVGSTIVEGLMLAVAICVMACPEGLPLASSFVSSLNMRNMLNDKVLIRKLSGVEAAGSINFLCTDKTGTLTTGNLKTIGFYDKECNKYLNFSDIPNDIQNDLFLGVVMNSESICSSNKIIGGNTTEQAMLHFISKNIRNKNSDKCEILKQLAFNSRLKFSGISLDYGSFLKGAPEILLPLCSNKSKEQVQNIQNLNNDLADKCIRTIAVIKSNNTLFDVNNLNANEWELIGIFAIRDEIRPEAKTAVETAQVAGIQVVMVTGDRLETAKAIANETGILKNSEDLVVTSKELNLMSDSEISKNLKRIKVVARAIPSDKYRIVEIAEKLNMVVGMTGDGVNDSSAIKKADVGFSMGSGTEIAKDASDIVILDNNFNSIVKSVLYGRTVFVNIRRFLTFQLSINVAAVIISFIAPLLGFLEPLSIVQILWINIIMDTLAAIAFGSELASSEYMKNKPIPRDESIITNQMKKVIIISSIFVTIFGMVIIFGNSVPDILKRTCYFMVFVFCSLATGLICRKIGYKNDQKISKPKGLFVLIYIIIFFVQLTILFFGGNIFGIVGTLVDKLLILLFSVIVGVIEYILLRFLNI
ncbi:MAG: calcium-translocating P-type ATPase, PMCA-type [Candidatus Ancillula sp.]|jgi:calcium-translocating P-type ATPase|nr:calcium-translocating P-type ATPase, PMCA-type [Candidatus Ancillula sp.]